MSDVIPREGCEFHIPFPATSAWRYPMKSLASVRMAAATIVLTGLLENLKTTDMESGDSWGAGGGVDELVQRGPCPIRGAGLKWHVYSHVDS